MKNNEIARNLLINILNELRNLLIAQRDFIQTQNFSVLFLFLLPVLLFADINIYAKDQSKVFIVKLNENSTDPLSSENIEEIAKELSGRHGGKVLYVFDTIFPGFAVYMSESELESLSMENTVDYVTPDTPLYLDDIQPNAPWHLDRVDQRTLPLDGSYNYTKTGLGTFAFVVDSGIMPNHMEFGGISASRVQIGADFVGGNGIDCNGHGTHVAGIIGGNISGISKQTRLVSVRVFDCNGAGSAATAIAGLNWVANHRAPRSVVNLSFSGTINRALDDAVLSLIRLGIPVVIAAGNNNSDVENFSPAHIREAIVVGASDQTDRIAEFSNYGKGIDLFAPGTSITSASINGGFEVRSGTSMAAPIVTGVLSLMMEGVNLPSDLSPIKLEENVVADSSWDIVNQSIRQSSTALIFSHSLLRSGGQRPLFRYWCGSLADHFYTSSYSSLGSGTGCYIIERSEGFIFTSAANGLLPLYRYWNSVLGDHFYTTSFSELGTGRNGYYYEGIEGYVFQYSGFGRRPLYRYWNSALADHFYTTRFEELGQSGNGYVFENIAGYLSE